MYQVTRVSGRPVPATAPRPARAAGLRVALATVPLVLAVACAVPQPVHEGPTPFSAVPVQSAAGGRDTRMVQASDRSNAPSVERLFTGRFAGVTVASGLTGGLRIRIRGGANSFVAGQEPLYVIDGTPLPAGTGEISFLAADDIEKIEVLKNPADVGLYGVRGTNGVIRITTTRPVSQ